MNHSTSSTHKNGYVVGGGVRTFPLGRGIANPNDGTNSEKSDRDMLNELERRLRRSDDDDNGNSNGHEGYQVPSHPRPHHTPRLHPILSPIFTLSWQWYY